MENRSAPITDEDAPYVRLRRHLDQQPVGFPASRTGADIRLLKHIFTPHQARIAACLDHAPKPLETIFQRASSLVSSKAALAEELDRMVRQGAIEAEISEKGRCYANTPLVVGMYELQVERLTPELLRDFNAYTSEKSFGISFLSTRVSQMRTVPVRKSIDPALPIPAYDDIRCILETAAPPFVILPCICRRKAELQGSPCQQTARTETCLAMGSMARSVMAMEIGREISRETAMDIMAKNQEQGLVLQPSNTQKPGFICSCCGCCCGMLGIQKDLPAPLDFWSANFKAVLDPEACRGCGRCVDQCHTRALSLPRERLDNGQRPKAVLNAERCIGCGLCITACPGNALSLGVRLDAVQPPRDRHALNQVLMAGKKDPLAKIRVIGKLARGMIVQRDLRLLKKQTPISG